MLSIMDPGSQAFKNWITELHYLPKIGIVFPMPRIHVAPRDMPEMDQLSLAVNLELRSVVKYLLNEKQQPEEICVIRLAAAYAIAYCPDIFYTFWNRGLDVEAPIKFGRSFLHVAAQHGRIEIARILIDAGAAFNKEDNEQRIPLYYAAQNRSQAMLSLLIEKGARVNHKDRYGKTVLYEVIARFRWKRETYLLEDKSSESVTRDGFACSTAELLIKHGTEVDSRNNQGRTALSYASSQWHHTASAIVKLLIIFGAEVDSRDCEGRTALSYAASALNRAVTSLLLEHGAQIDSRDNRGRTPISHAADALRCKDSTTVALLIQQGAHIDSRCNEMRTPLSYAADFGLDSIIKCFIENGAAVNGSDWKGNTPLIYLAQAEFHRVCDSGEQLSSISTLLDNGANPFHFNEDGQSPLLLTDRLFTNCLHNLKEKRKEAVKEEIKSLLRRYGAREIKLPTSPDTLSQVVAQLTVNLIDILTDPVGMQPADHEIALKSSIQLFRGWNLHPTVSSIKLQDDSTIEQRTTDFCLGHTGIHGQDIGKPENSRTEHSNVIQGSSGSSQPGFSQALKEPGEYGGLTLSQEPKPYSDHLRYLAEVQQRLFNINRCVYYLDSHPRDTSASIDDLITKVTGQKSSKVQRRPRVMSPDLFGSEESDVESNDEL